MKIVLLGYMGSGKSTVGKALSKCLGFRFVDLDTYIESEEGMTVSAIFEQKGELYFRKKEHEYLAVLLQEKEALILSLGGGTPCYSNNMKLVLEHTTNVFYLRLTVPELTIRLKEEKENRPLIAAIKEEDLPEFIGKHLFERNNFYNLATNVLDVKEKTVDVLTGQIEGLLG